MESFGIIGKGYDFMNVIHEWGAHKPEQIIQLIQYAIQILQLPQVILLTPCDLTETFQKVFEKHGKEEKYPMGLMKKIQLPNASLKKKEDSFFIWGLDSI